MLPVVVSSSSYEWRRLAALSGRGNLTRANACEDGDVKSARLRLENPETSWRQFSIQLTILSSPLLVLYPSPQLFIPSCALSLSLPWAFRAAACPFFFLVFSLRKQSVRSITAEEYACPTRAGIQFCILSTEHRY